LKVLNGESVGRGILDHPATPALTVREFELYDTIMLFSRIRPESLATFGGRQKPMRLLR
jgi:hypothetical protein